MTPDLLREAGQALYGASWQSDIARELEVSDRTVRRWLAGTRSLPATIAADLDELCGERRALLHAMQTRLRQAAA